MKLSELVEAPKSMTRRNTPPRATQTVALINAYTALSAGDEVMILEGFVKYSTDKPEGIGVSHLKTFTKNTGVTVKRCGMTDKGAFFVILDEPKPKPTSK